MSSAAECPFCQALQTQMQRVVLEGKLTYVMLSNPRLMPGHTLVIPKRHVEAPWDVTPEERLEIFELVNEVTKKLLADGWATGCDVRQNYRPFLPQGRVKVDHVHYHVLPRTFQDAYYQAVDQHQTAMFADLSDNEREEILKKLQ